MNKSKLADVGVIVGRFQVHELHDGHHSIIQTVRQRHKKVIIFLGLSPTKSTINNPLDFESRKKMILESYRDVSVLYIKDTPIDSEWSNNLDEMIKDLTTPNQSVILYGGRDSFIEHYTGKYETEILEYDIFFSGTELRKNISSSVKGTPDFRSGAIWAMFNQYPKVYPTVDVIIERYENNILSHLLLVRKKEEKLFRFVGGFAQPQSDSYEEDAAREVQEEVGVDIGGIDELKYLGSLKIDDWRYRKENDKIKTIIYVAQYRFGTPTPDDDVCEAKWFSINELKHNNIVPEHRPIFDLWIENKQQS